MRRAHRKVRHIMNQILVYGDSLSWGIVPGSRKRFGFAERWPGILEAKLNGTGLHFRVIEDCLNGRRTDWDDPIKPGRRGTDGLGQRIEINSPLELVIILLGTNDFQCMHQNSPRDSANGIAKLIAEVRSAPLEPTMSYPDILVIAPPLIQKAKGAISEKFAGAEDRAQGLTQAIQAVAREQVCHFFDAASVTQTSRVDGVHLDLDQHAALGTGLFPIVRGIIEPKRIRHTDGDQGRHLHGRD